MKFVLKWIVNGAIVVALLMYYSNVTVWNAVILATLLTIAAYFIGDQFILRTTNNLVATVVDFILAYGVLWLAADQMDWDLNHTEILTISVIIGIAEWFLHRYVFQTEFKAPNR